MKKKIFEEYIFIFELFIVGSLIGFVFENLLTLFRGHYALRQGLIYEPLIPIYGIGGLVFYFAYHLVDLKKMGRVVEILMVFGIGFLLGGVTEYIGSLIQEKVFGTISWDYSYLKLNLGGRTSVFHSAIWGLMGVCFYKFLLPVLNRQREHLKKKWMRRMISVLSVLVLFDCTISWMACYRQTERRNNLEPGNAIESFLDQHYPDEYLNIIFNNARVPE